MAKSIVTNKFRIHLAQQFVESFTETANNTYYLVASKHTPYSNGDATIPSPGDNNTELEVDIYDDGIFGKKITDSDVNLMIPKYVWTSNTVYDYYDPDDSNLFSKQFYVVRDGGTQYFIYKCLDNNFGAPSTEQPSDTTESACNFITTADGYTWKLMYKVNEATFEKFATDDLMPVYTSANVSGNTTSGSIDIIRISNTGSGYIATLSGQFNTDDLRTSIPAYSGNNTTYRLATGASSNNDFYVGSALYISGGTGQGQVRRIVDYISTNRVAVINAAFSVAPSTDSTYTVAPSVTIQGDGTGASAFATVTSNSSVNNFISKINIVTRGSGYTWATATVTGNTGGISNNATVKLILPPTGGHGFDAISELGAKSVCISSTFNKTESGYITVENDYRKVSILKDPLFKNVHMTLDTEYGAFTAGETVYQADVKGLAGFVSGNTTTNVITGVNTVLDKGLKAGDYVIITDSALGNSIFNTISSVTNSTYLTLTSNLTVDIVSGRISHLSILASGIKDGNSSPYISLKNATPKFVLSKLIIGADSGATANVTAIDVTDKNFNNWNTFDNRAKISYSGVSGGMIPEDKQIYQTDATLSNAYFHSSNSTFVFITRERGLINADPSEPIRMMVGSNSVTLGSTKYTSDIVRSSGQVLYVENSNPITRNSDQSETIRLVLNF